MTESARNYRRLALCLLCLLLATPVLSRQPARPDYFIQVFALNGPVCPVAQPDVDCPDALLPGASLLLQKRDRRRWRDVAVFETNARGYATVLVHRRGLYRVTVPPDEPSPFPRPMSYPTFEGDVSFKVPARHSGPAGFARLTPVVVMFDSGIR